MFELLKRHLRRCVILLFLLPHILLAKSISQNDRPNTAVLDLIKIPFGQFSFRYERALCNYLTLTAPVDVQTISASFLPTHVLNIARILGWYNLPDFGFSFGAGAKFIYHGFYAEPVVKLGYAQFVVRKNTDTFRGFTLQPTLNLGYQYRASYGLIVDAGLGASLSTFFYNKGYDYQWLPNLSVSLGYGW